MQWLKHIAVDLLATAAIALVVFSETSLLLYVVYIYTFLMVIARAFTLFNRNFRAVTIKKISDAPVWIYHTLYFCNVSILIYGAFYLTAAGWLFIWVVASYVHHQQNKG